jgi:hypothetical protein
LRSVSSASLTITADNKTRLVGAADPAFTYVVSPSVSLTTRATCTSTATIASPIGSYPITCSGAVLAGYSISYVGGTLTVAATPPTCVVPTVTISPADPHGQNSQAVSVTVTFSATVTPGSVTAWEWSLGDGTQSPLASPGSYTYNYPTSLEAANGHPTVQQVWHVVLTVTTTLGCTGTSTTTVTLG